MGCGNRENKKLENFFISSLLLSCFPPFFVICHHLGKAEGEGSGRTFEGRGNDILSERGGRTKERREARRKDGRTKEVARERKQEKERTKEKENQNAEGKKRQRGEK